MCVNVNISFCNALIFNHNSFSASLNIFIGLKFYYGKKLERFPVECQAMYYKNSMADH